MKAVKYWLLLTLCLSLGACQPSSDSLKTPVPQPQTNVVTEELPATTSKEQKEVDSDKPDAAAITQRPDPQLPKPSAPPKPVQRRSARTLAGQNRLYDKANPAYSRLQKANQALVGFPADRMGRVDWVAALRQGKIQPRAERLRQGRMEVRDSEIIMTNTREMPHVRFPHAAHTEWLTCKNCHDAIFKPVKGAHRITMDEIFKGRYCGACHDRVSFSVFICERCHSVTHAGSPEAWWSQ